MICLNSNAATRQQLLFPISEIGYVHRPAPPSDRDGRQWANHAPGHRVVNINRASPGADRSEKIRDQKEVAPAMAGLLRLHSTLGPVGVLKLALILLQRLPSVLRAAPLQVNLVQTERRLIRPARALQRILAHPGRPRG